MKSKSHTNFFFSKNFHYFWLNSFRQSVKTRQILLGKHLALEIANRIRIFLLKTILLLEL